MKKYLTVMLTLTMCLLFSACQNSDNADYSLYNTMQSTFDENSQIVTSSQEQISSEQSVTSPSSSSEPQTVVSHGNTPTQSSSSDKVLSSSVPTPPACKHNYSLTANTVTCTKDGQATYTCSLCKATYKEKVNAVGHKWNGHKCMTCGAIDENKMKENLYNWATANSVEENFSKYYYLPSDSRYKFSAIGGGSYTFIFDDKQNNEYISLSVYGFEKNTCYINYILNDLQIEGEFPMDAVHSKDRNFFNIMNAASNDAAAKKNELVSTLRSKIDGFLKKFENEMLIPKTDITLNNLGFKCY